MRILWHSNAPWVGTGYGVQSALFGRLLRDMGHEVAFSAFYGLSGTTLDWDGFKVYGAGTDKYGADVIGAHAAHWQADIIVTLVDSWSIDPRAFQGIKIPVLQWCPVDVQRWPSILDRAHFQACPNVIPVAMTQYGAGLLGTPLVVPHGVDLSLFYPQDRYSIRAGFGLLDADLKDNLFIIGANLINKNDIRKDWPTLFEAVSRLKQDNVRLAVHTHASSGFPLADLAEQFGISDRILWNDQYAYVAGMVDGVDLAAWYNACDVLVQATMAEGFGLPMIEAQACGVPVIATDTPQHHEVAGDGAWYVASELVLNPQHRSWWSKARVDDLTKKLNAVVSRDKVWQSKRVKARQNAERFDAHKVALEAWKPLLDALQDVPGASDG